MYFTLYCNKQSVIQSVEYHYTRTNSCKKWVHQHQVPSCFLLVPGVRSWVLKPRIWNKSSLRVSFTISSLPGHGEWLVHPHVHRAVAGLSSGSHRHVIAFCHCVLSEQRVKSYRFSFTAVRRYCYTLLLHM